MVLPDLKNSESKKAQVTNMFNSISDRYDFLNHVLSFGIDFWWRKKAIHLLKTLPHDVILDVATGTADLAIQSASLSPKKIVGIDVSDGMLEIGRKKINKRKLEHIIELKKGDSECIQFEDNFFDAVTVGFGVRNFENLEIGLAEMLRVVKPGGRIVILEFSKPVNFLFKYLYKFYFSAILPFIGKKISNNTLAYEYLPQSVYNFPNGNNFVTILNRLGYKNVECSTLTFGISTLYWGSK